MADLKSEISGTLAKLILGLMMTPAEFDAKQLNKAVAVNIFLYFSLSTIDSFFLYYIIKPSKMMQGSKSRDTSKCARAK